MKIELILLGVIGLVFLVDFILKGTKKPSIENVVDQIEGGEAVKTKSNNPLVYIVKRKKNFTIFIISVFISKILIHFLVYRSITNNGIYNPYGLWIPERNIIQYYDEFEASLSYHIDNVFFEKVWLFIPAIILVSIVVWFFNDKIKAR